MKKIYKKPLFYVNILLLVVAILIITSVNAAQFKNSSLVKKVIAAVQTITGEGTLNKIASFAGVNSIGDSQIYDNGTNVGIGTTAPGAKLEVSAPDASMKLKSSSGSSFVFLDSPSTSGISTMVSGVLTSSYLYDPATRNVFFSTYPGGNAGIAFAPNGTINLYVSPSGSVGIGTTAPAYKLDVAGDVKGTRLCIGVDCRNAWPTGGAGGGVSKIIAGSNIAISPVSGTGDVTINSTGGGGLPVGTSGQTLRYDGTNWVANSAIYNNGIGVGIGTSNPQNKLSVLGSVGLLRDPISTAVPGPGPELFLQSPSNNTSSVDDGWKWCGGAGQPACPTDTTPSGDANNAYQCPSGSAGQNYVDVSIISGAIQKGYVNLTCLAGTDVFSLRTNAGTLEFLNTAGNAKMVINQNGNVGIGTTNPGNALFPAGIKLDVVGDSGGNSNNQVGMYIRNISPVGPTGIGIFRGGVYQGALAVTDTAGLFMATGPSNPNGLTLATSQGWAMRVLDNGNVGIGTANPTQKLEISNNYMSAKFGSGLLAGNIGSQSDEDGLYIKDNGIANRVTGLIVETVGNNPAGMAMIRQGVVKSSVWYASNADRLMISTYDPATTITFGSPLPAGTGSWVMNIKSNGNVGIGTDAPSQRLDVVGGGIHATGDICTDIGGGKCLSSAGVGGGYWALNGTNIYNTNTNNIGIGTATPLTKLYVSGSSGTSGAITIDTNGQSQLEFRINGVQKSAVAATSNLVGFYNFDRSSIPLAISLSNDNIGIGTTVPGAKLEIAGQIKITGGSPGVGKVLTSDASGLASWQTGALTGYSVPVGGGQEVWLRGNAALLSAKCTTWGSATCSNGAVVCGGGLIKTPFSGPYHLDYGEGGSYGGNTFICVKQN